MSLMSLTNGLTHSIVNQSNETLKCFICSAMMAPSPLAKKLRNSSNTGSHFDAKRGASKFEAPLFLLKAFGHAK